MTPERWQRVRSILADALDQPSHLRRSFIATTCGNDEHLKTEINKLLDADAAADALPSFSADPRLLTGLIEDPGGEAEGDNPSERLRPTMVGRRVGRFLVSRLIGVGGMGTVYEARQEHPSRVIALKVLRCGLTSRAALKRFQFEAQALGRMQHPCIAQVFEAGVDTCDGVSVPFFAMELVPNALGLSDYATARCPGLADRLGLFIRVCEGVQHGHLRGVIHRDLKPTNILVSADDEAATPKIIDFGVARALDSQNTGVTLLTEARQLIGTLNYMSPEQCAAGVGDPERAGGASSGTDIDARSDVYSLGVVLYELVTGSLPYDLANANTMEAASIIRARLPKRPHVDAPGVRGDLQVVMLKALEKEPARRYQSAQELADDLRRYLAGEAILARPSHAGYYARVFVRRNKLLVLSVLAVMLSLLVGLALAGVQYRRAVVSRNAALVAEQHAIEQTARAEAEAKRAKRAVDFLASTLSSGNNASASYIDAGASMDERFTPYEARYYSPQRVVTKPGVQASLGDVLKAAVAALDTEVADDPLLQADLAMALRRGLDGTEQSHSLQFDVLRRAVENRRRYLGAAHADTIYAMTSLAMYCVGYNRWQEAVPLLEEALAACPKVYAPLSGWERYVNRCLVLALLFDASGVPRAMNVSQSIFERCRDAFGPDDPMTLHAEAMFCKALEASERFEEAESHGRHAFEGLMRRLGATAWLTGDAAIELGSLLWSRGLRQNEEEVRMLVRLHAECADAVVGPNTDASRSRWRHFGMALVCLGDYAEYERVMRRVLASAEHSLDPTRWETTKYRFQLAQLIILNHGDLDEAWMLALGAEPSPPSQAPTAKCYRNNTLGRLRLAAGDTHAALQHAQRTLEITDHAVWGQGTRQTGVDTWLSAQALELAAQAWIALDCPEDATLAFEESLRLVNLHNIPLLPPRVMILRNGLKFFEAIGDHARSGVWRKTLCEVGLEEGELPSSADQKNQ